MQGTGQGPHPARDRGAQQNDSIFKEKVNAFAGFQVESLSDFLGQDDLSV
jgi:hypothetical protein